MSLDWSNWFGNRLREILEEKGLKQKTIAIATGMSASTISRILRGRYATIEEIERIAQALHVSVDRLKQTDVDLGPEATSPVKWVPDHAVEIEEAHRNVSMALGVTERGLAYQKLGASFFVAKEFAKALTAYKNSNLLLQNSSDRNLKFRSFQSLIATLTIQKKYDEVEKHFEEVDEMFGADQDFYHDVFLRFKASMYAIHLHRYDTSIAIFQRCLEHARSRDDQTAVNHLLCQIAKSYFFQNEYRKAVAYYEQWFANQPVHATPNLRDLIDRKDYAKTLFAAGEIQKALQVLKGMLKYVQSLNTPQLLGQSYLLIALITKDLTFTKKVLELTCSNSLKMLAAIMIYYSCDERESDSFLQTIVRNMLSDEAEV